MARSRAVSQTLTCVSCSTPKRVMWWYGDRSEEWNTVTIQSPCASCSVDPPHWQLQESGITARSGGGGSAAAVIYTLPDGDFMSVDTSTPDMVATAARTGVRREFSSIRELRAFCRTRAAQKVEDWKRMADEGLFGVSTPDFKQWQELLYSGVSNDVLDYDENTIREQRGRMGDVWREDRRRNDAAVARFRDQISRTAGMRLGRVSDSRRYERLRGKGNR